MKQAGILTLATRVLNVGCGNSLFSEHMYDDGYTAITNIDFSEKAIKKMSKRSEKKRPLMKYLLMDIFDMKFEKEQFEIVIDKGGIDAIFSEETEENDLKIKKLFNSIADILCPKGYYICISLLQDYILRSFLDFFHNDLFAISIFEMNIENWKYMPFMVAIQKRSKEEAPSIPKQTSNITLHLVKEKLAGRDASREETQSQLNTLQFQRNYLQDMKTLRPGKRFTMEVGQVGSQNLARYSLFIVDSESKKTLSQVCT
jgi:SAM-dependent methyltransferase